MLYWLFTAGREFLSSLLLPLMCLTLVLPLLVSAAFGAGIQRSESNERRTWQLVALVSTYALVLLGITALYLTLLDDLAIQPARGRQTTSAVIQFIVGAPRNINTLRLFLFGIMLTFVWLVVSIGLHNGIRKIDDVVRRAQPHQPPRHQNFDGGKPGGIQSGRHRSGSGQP